MSVTQEDFAYVRRLVADESAQTLSDDRRYLVDNRLAAVAVREGHRSVTELIAAARASEPRLRPLLVEALCVHETLFFRDEHPFAALGDVVLPERLEGNGGRRLAVWSAATSTGQEAYSVAMLIREKRWVIPQLDLIATDLSCSALTRARAGRYSDLESRRGLPAALRDRYFSRVDRAWQIHDEIRDMVRFEQLNLARPFEARIGTVDVVLLRNVLIYLDGPARVAIARRMAGALTAGGYLLLGGSETIGSPDGLFEPVRIGRCTVFRRTEVPV